MLANSEGGGRQHEETEPCTAIGTEPEQSPEIESDAGRFELEQGGDYARLTASSS